MEGCGIGLAAGFKEARAPSPLPGAALGKDHASCTSCLLPRCPTVTLTVTLTLILCYRVPEEELLHVNVPLLVDGAVLLNRLQQPAGRAL